MVWLYWISLYDCNWDLVNSFSRHPPPTTPFFHPSNQSSDCICAFQEVLHLAQTDMQLAATSAFLQILQKNLVPIQNYSQTFLQTILNSVDSKDPGNTDSRGPILTSGLKKTSVLVALISLNLRRNYLYRCLLGIRS